MKALIFILLFVMCSCSTFKSGKYFHYKGDVSVEKVAKMHGLTSEELLLVNNGSIKKNQWIFIPTNIGLVSYGRNQTNFSNITFENVAMGEFSWPVLNRYVVSSDYGKRNGRAHDGIDIPAPTGTPILASKSGRVIYSGKGIRGYGNLTILAHKNGLFTIYAHAYKNLTKKGDKIKGGSVIAYVGNTGRSSGPHLHFEIRKRSVPQNPMVFLKYNREWLANN